MEHGPLHVPRRRGPRSLRRLARHRPRDRGHAAPVCQPPSARPPARPAGRELSVADRDFRRWWAEHDVYQPKYGSKRYHDPLVGDLTLGFEAFTPAGDPDQTLGLYTVEPGSPSENALHMLAGWTADSTRTSSPKKPPAMSTDTTPHPPAVRHCADERGGCG
nr:hypothetical protein [Streptomyces sp. NBC_01450]